MATNNQLNVGLSGSTGTGTFVGSTDPTISNPKINQINDTNGTPIVTFVTTASAVNYVQIVNESTGNNPTIAAIGSDTNINLELIPKGTGSIYLGTAGSTNQLIITSGTSGQHTTNFQLPTTSATDTYTFPDATGTVGLITADTTFVPSFTSSGGGSATYTTQSGIYTQIGSLVFFEINIILASLPSAGNVTISGLPVTVGTMIGTLSVYATALDAVVASPISALSNSSTTTLSLYKWSAGGSTQLTVADCAATSQFILTGFYHT